MKRERERERERKNEQKMLENLIFLVNLKRRQSTLQCTVYLRNDLFFVDFCNAQTFKRSRDFSGSGSFFSAPDRDLP